MPIVTLTTDFGLSDPYVAEIKAVILAINPMIKVVDISHLIDKFDVRMGAFVLAEAVPYFANGSVHTAVVDPGVGTQRMPIAIETERAFFVGPDNGVLTLAAECTGELKSIHMIANKEMLRPEISEVFHGRDIFAPVAAHLATGRAMTDLGPRIMKARTLRFPKVRKEGGALKGEVIHVDDFGNVITNFVRTDLGLEEGSFMTVRLEGRKLRIPFHRTYSDVEERHHLAIVGSHGFVEIAVNRGNASRTIGIRTGDELTLLQGNERRIVHR